MKNALNNQVGMLGDMFLWLVANLKQGVIYFIKQALPPNISARSVVVSKILLQGVQSGLQENFKESLGIPKIYFPYTFLHQSPVPYLNMVHFNSKKQAIKPLYNSQTF